MSRLVITRVYRILWTLVMTRHTFTSRCVTVFEGFLTIFLLVIPPRLRPNILHSFNFSELFHDLLSLSCRLILWNKLLPFSSRLHGSHTLMSTRSISFTLFFRYFMFHTLLQTHRHSNRPRLHKHTILHLTHQTKHIKVTVKHSRGQRKPWYSPTVLSRRLACCLYWIDSSCVSWVRVFCPVSDVF